MTATAYGTNPKKDGALMCSGANWKDSSQQATNMASAAKGKNLDQGHSTKDKKYQNLSSNVFGEVNPDTPSYDNNAGRVSLTTTSNWSNSQTKPVNK